MTVSTAARLAMLLLLGLCCGAFCRGAAKDRKNQSRYLLCALLALLLGLDAAYLASKLPPVYDEITVTALGRKNAESRADEIYIAGFEVDGREAKIDRVLEGKWFWSGDSYCWRSENDSRQPSGTTRTVRLAVPVGTERSIRFESNEWRGMAELRSGGQTQIVDTYSSPNAPLPDSSIKDQAAEQLRRLSLYALILLSGSAVLAAFCHSERRRERLLRNRWTLLYLFVAYAQLRFALCYAGTDCFWIDELWEIGWSVDLAPMERLNHLLIPFPPFAVFSDIWYSLAPYGERWLLLPWELAAACGVFLTGLAAREYAGERTGLLAALFTALSVRVLIQCSYEIRSYAFMFCFGALLLLLWLRRLRRMGREKAAEQYPIAAAMLLFVGQHYHAILLCAALFLLDLRLYLAKRIRPVCSIPYAFSALCCAPFILTKLFAGSFGSLDLFWMTPPTMNSVISLIDFLDGGSVLTGTAFLILVSAWLHRNAGRADAWTEKTGMLLFSLLFPALTVAVYGLVLNPRGSQWVLRYFTGLIPVFACLAGQGAVLFCEFLSRQDEKRSGRAICLALCLSAILISWPELYSAATTVRAPYREIADRVYRQSNDIFSKRTLVLSTDPIDVATGWREYYIERQGQRDAIQVLSWHSIEPEDLAQWDRIYLAHVHWPENLSEEMKLRLNLDFEETDSWYDGKLRAYDRK